METAKYPDMRMQGIWNGGGGRYSAVELDGVGKVAGDVEADRFISNGVATIQGGLTAAVMQFNGRLKVEGGIAGQELLLEGQLKAKGPLHADRCKINGAISIEGDCSAEQFEATGGIKIGGLLNGGQISIMMQGPSKIKEIGGEQIEVQRAKRELWSKLLGAAVPKWTPSLEAQHIEGDEVRISYTNAEVVRGDRVFIGPGCRIGLVEYRTELQIDPDAAIREEKKL
ncbi:hypothetical protein [Paenibacillus protaetiae]|uniref:Polymer-forming cytoskeletal protein n=1 Tax=Paenibacillus protaetiae TaxID=2509456 RepID=A0A4P6EW54_9BACL|nr:hypothetical protein [Paenibacillus protaetiae]QAY65939.1 hypothetical protein ET464_05610 [Paenibacillus protaetiae]